MPGCSDSITAASRSRTPVKYSELDFGHGLVARASREVATGSAVSADFASTQSGPCAW